MNNAQIFKKKIDKQNILVYNPESHFPVVLHTRGNKYLNLMLNNKDKASCLKVISESRKEEFEEFYDSINEIGFLKKSEENFDKIVRETPLSNKKRIYFHLTDRCNLHCTYCYNKDRRTDFTDLPLESWKEIIDKVAPHTGSILITGGEPFLNVNFDVILEYLRNKTDKIFIEAFSNANIDYSGLDKSHRIFSLLDKITLSCDDIEDNEDQNRKGFRITTFMKNIDWITKNGFADKVYINSVVAKGKLKEVQAVKQWTKKNNLHFTYALRLPNHISDKKYLPTLDEYKSIIFGKQLTQDSKSINKIPRTLKCSAAGNTLSIDSHGNCYPCQNFHYPEFKLGNLLIDSFDTILNSIPAKKLQSHHVLKVEKCRDCSLRYVCAGGCVADVYKLYGDINKHPKILCSYYKIGAISRLMETEYETD